MLKWKYDSRNKEWFVNDSPECYDYSIKRIDKKLYTLEAKLVGMVYPTVEHTFNKLKSAKQVAELIENG